MITKLILGPSRLIQIYTTEQGKRQAGGLRVEHHGSSFFVPLSPREQGRLAYALADHQNRKRDEIKELK